MSSKRPSEDYARIERAIRYIEAHAQEQPGLATLARAAGLSPHHFQRLFRRWAGISPKRFLQYLTLEHAKRRLEESRPVLEAALDAGLSGPGRLHDLFVTYEAMTPGEYKKRGAGLRLAYGVHPTPFGDCLLLATARGVCGLGFLSVGGEKAALARFKKRWPKARFERAPEETERLAARAFGGGTAPLSLRLMGTPFQLKVWEALLAIPPGTVASYGALARVLGRPRAIRAVAGAIAANPIAYLVPCHRVIRESGAMEGYAWGLSRKRAMLARESASRERAAATGRRPARLSTETDRGKPHADALFRGL